MSAISRSTPTDDHLCREFYENSRVHHVEGDYRAGWGNGVEIVTLGFPLGLIIGPVIAHFSCRYCANSEPSAKASTSDDEPKHQVTSCEPGLDSEMDDQAGDVCHSGPTQLSSFHQNQVY